MQILLPENAYHSDEKYDLISSVLNFTNRLFQALYQPEELPSEALQSYYVDYYLAQVNNGGMSQFVYNSRWHPRLIGYVRSGLERMGARQHLALFERVEAAVESLGDKLDEFLAGNYFLDNEETRSSWNELTDEFYELQEQEDLVALNHAFIRGLPHVRVLPVAEYYREMENLAAQVPDKAEREAEAERIAQENEPEEYPVIRNLCQMAGQELISLNAISFGQYQGQAVAEWHLSTSAGHHFVIFADGEAMLFNGAKQLVAKCEVELASD